MSTMRSRLIAKLFQQVDANDDGYLSETPDYRTAWNTHFKIAPDLDGVLDVMLCRSR